MTAEAGEVTSRQERLLLVVNNPEFFLSHRLPIALAARRAGYDVAVASPPGAAVAKIRAHGLEHHAFPLSRSGTNPFRDSGSLLALVSLFRRLRPSIVHAVAIKSVALGGVAARIAGVPSLVCAVSGLGFAFLNDGLRATLARKVVTRLFRHAFAHPNCRIVFQNADDLNGVSAMARLAPERAVLIRGSGVDLQEFRPAAEPPGRPVVMLPARMLRDKGVPEFVEAARLTRSAGLDARFVLVGDTDRANPASLREAELMEWQREGVVEWWGVRTDMPDVLPSAHVVVLPSHREGMPKVLLEAAACGRPVVTTDVPGCRDAIEADRTGLLVPLRQPRALADAIAALVRDGVRRREMGAAARKLAERQFSLERVVDAHLSVYAELAAMAARKSARARTARPWQVRRVS
jgi:glycosyltransferase involved in cell wall biosynthesis